MNMIMDILNQVMYAEECYFSNRVSREKLMEDIRRLRSEYEIGIMRDSGREGIKFKMALLFILRRVRHKIILEDRLMEMIDSEVAFVRGCVSSIISEPFGVKPVETMRPTQQEAETRCAKPRTRANFPMDTSQLLRSWLKENMDNPYPSDAEKAYLCQKTGLGPAQINNWFINARRRILPFMKGKRASFK
ncbi:TALE/PBX transcription factor [Encephalitozoon intestinalis ATCC 50506]|uniref:TALE/PBX transcription factor n=1 Tax=Encephalitozoon intestinalis (strain ATCC 50506) TaxID=876142 RepID=E0S9T3_ENCIT|nr:TALE/PBX transcription factor [Encephalitozoon intestinalis ATCC 50506]ADM12468.1 TALE/PBX transcription factor [Encephalitozoon intestinalis ATCC 50506]UTX46305.1 homeodomain-containing protein [Encephalitozoon intestinalis]